MLYRIHDSIFPFFRNQRGNVGMIFGLALVPLVGMSGAAVDYSRASQLRTKMAVASDAAVLAAVTAKGQTLAERKAVADVVFAANLGIDLSLISVTGSLSKLSGSAYRYDATASYTYLVLQALPGFGPSAQMAVTSSAKSGDAFMEMALVLDNTGSMGSSNKMVELKKALCGNEFCSNSNPTSGFLKTMKDLALEDNQIRIALVPFDIGVRVPANIEAAVAAGTDVPGTFSYGGAGYCSSNLPAANRVSWTGPGLPAFSWFRFADRDLDPIASNLNSSGVNVGAGCGTGRATRATWQGCLWDRDQDSNRDTMPSGVDPATISTMYPAVNCSSGSLARMAPLADVRYNTAALVNSIATMTPSGNTNVTIGATWGVNMLTPGLPMSTSAPASVSLTRYMVLLTDGDNTRNRSGTNQLEIDARTVLACSNAKAQGIIVYSVRVIDGNRTMLQNCASGLGNYYEVSNAAQLTGVFASIADRMGSVRLTN